MENTDFELIKRTLSGDQDAFTALVEKYQKRVHALAWRKTGDFHVAEEITQDTFLRAYRKLGTLKNPDLFAGWLYVIANRLCNTWFEKKAPDMQSLETVPAIELEEHVYSEYTAEQREERASEKRVDLVKRLLQKLPESERIVVTLHYLAGSSVKEISEFLGVSLNTVKSRLYRARQRLQKEDHMVRETLGSFQPSANLTENIIRTLKETGTQIDPVVPSGSKPIVPWVIATSTLVLVVLMLGLGAQHLARFQQPYSLDATSEMAVDIVDAAVLMNLPSDPNAQNQIGNVDAPEKSEGTSQHSDAKLSSPVTGRVVDEAGNIVSGIQIATIPVEDGDGAWFPTQRDENGEPIDMSQYQAETDSDGRFTITDAITGPVLLTLLPYHKPKPDIRLLKVEIGGLFFYPSGSLGVLKDGIVFSTTPDENIENVKVTVLHSPKIRGTVNQMDGTPLTNKTVELHIQERSLNQSSRIETSVSTDENGYFELYLHKDFLIRNTTDVHRDYLIRNTDVEGPTFYIINVVYVRLRARSILIKNNAQNREFVFNLKILPDISARSSFSSTLDAIGVWVVNPENGHAYKKIGCKNPNDAIAQAGKEDAYLVTINDQTEQNWLEKVFGGSDAFIGLNDIAEEGQWQWQSGETVVYTNWAKEALEDNNSKHEDYVILSYGKWKDIGPRSRNWFKTRTAILEKVQTSVKK